MNHRFIAAGLALIALNLSVLWFLMPPSIEMTDASKPSEVTLRTTPRDNSVYALEVTGSGYIEGEGDISLVLNGQPYKAEQLKGRVRFKWEGDWYSPEAVVRYTPRSASSGSIKLRYRFKASFAPSAPGAVGQ